MANGSNLPRLFLFAAFLMLSPLVRATPVTWGPPGSSPGAGLLDPALIPTNSPYGVRYSNVNNEGYDIVVVTKSLNQDGAGVLPWSLERAWWFEGGAASSTGSSIPYSTVEFHFYLAGTWLPVAVTGVHFRFEDVENGERLRGFAYWDALETKFAGSFLDPRIFTFASGAPVVHLSDSSVDSGISSSSGTQEGRWVEVDLSAFVLSGFTFQTGRASSNYGSMLMAGLGDITLTNELTIQPGTDQNVSAGPAFVAGSGTASLTTTSLLTALSGTDASVQAAAGQNVSINEKLVSSSGYSLGMQGANIVSGTSALVLTSTTGNAGSLSLVAAQSVWLTRVATDSSLGNGGNILLTGSGTIKVSGSINSSSDTVLGKGGDVDLQAGRAILTDVVRTGGGGGITRLGGGGNISLAAGGSLRTKAVYANSANTPSVTLVSSTISLGKPGIVAADISGTLSLLKPDAADGASISITGTITGSGALLIGSGTGTTDLNTTALHSGTTTVASGNLALHAHLLPNSDLVLQNSASLTPGVTTMGGYVSAKSLTVGTHSTLNATIASGTFFDQVQTSGGAQLDGILNLTFKSGFVPDMDSVFQVLVSGTVNGTFGAYQGLRLDDRVLVPVYDGTSLILVTSEIPTGASQPLQDVPITGIAVTEGGYYDGLTTSIDGPSLVTTATLIGGTASSDTIVTMSLADSGTIGFQAGTGLNGTVLNLEGTGQDKIVVQLDYNEAAVIAAVGDERNMFVASSSDGGPFINAVYSNTDLPGEPNTPTQFFRAYNPDTDFHLGYFGVDTVNNRIWAVIDHNSAYGLGVWGAAMPDGPIPVTQPATTLSESAATLNALVNPNGAETAVQFEIDTDPTLANATLLSGTTLAAGSSFVAVSLPFTALASQTTYYYRVDGITSSGTKSGDILSFVTSPAPAVVSVAASIPDAYEFGPVAGQFSFAQTGTASVSVSYVISGAAANGSRYTIAAGPVTVPPAGSAATLAVTPIPNDLYDGNQSVVLTLVSGSNYALGSPNAATVTIHDKPLDQWKLTCFGADANNQAISGDAAVNNSAGISNLMAYALGMDPKTASADGLPKASISSNSGSVYLALGFNRDPAASDAIYSVQGSSDLKTWTTISQFSGGQWSLPEVVTETQNGTGVSVQVRDTQSMDSAKTRVLRLQVTR